MDKKRIFIAINLPENIKEKIISWQEKNSHLGVRWTKRDNMHVTLAFIGDIDEETLQKTVLVISEAARCFNRFEIRLEKIVPGPSEANPRMIWIEMAPNETLKQLNTWVDNALVKNHIPYEDTHAFYPHITVARSNNFELRGKKISADIDLHFMAESVDIMESRLLRTGVEYKVIEKILLN